MTIDMDRGIRESLTGRHARRCLALGHPEAMKRATQAGLGFCLLFRSSVEPELRLGLLREVTVEGPDLSVPLVVVTRTNKRLSTLQQQLIDEIRRKSGGSDPASRGIGAAA